MIVVEEKCYLCGKHAKFFLDDNAVLYREAVCEYCGASIRNSDSAKIIVLILTNKDICLTDAISDLKKYKILGTISGGIIHSCLKQLPGFVYGEYFDDVESGRYKNGIMCIDLKNSPFEDDFFDVIITEDVLEHIDDINMAFREINRILKPQGVHIFSVPLHQNKRTLDRTYLENKVYHDDPIRPGGALVYTDFGDDIESILDAFGMKTERFIEHQFHKIVDITNADLDYENYLELKNEPLKYYRYNSIIFCSRKIQKIPNSLIYKASKINELDFTGERFIPAKVTGEITAEHLHRYSAILDLVENKVVVDAACGEGYGSFILSQRAKQVFGVDIDQAAILCAQEKYCFNSIGYLNASIQKLPFENHSIDVVVSFETIEHVDEIIQRDFLEEIKRVLKDDGILIISTPDKSNYSDKYNYQNEFHVKEFYFNEFRNYLTHWFSYVCLYDQGIETLSLIHSVEQNSNRFKFLNQAESWKINKRYIVAICSEQTIADVDWDIQSIMHQDDVSYGYNNMMLEEMSKTIRNQAERINEQGKMIGQYIMSLIKGKKIVFFGTGSAVNKIYANCLLKPEYFVDNNSQKWGETFDGKKIYAPKQLLQEGKENLAIVIASQYFKDISAQLKEMGFEENVHYWNGGNLAHL